MVRSLVRQRQHKQLWFVLALASLVLAALVMTGRPAPAGAQAVTVSIQNFAFSPATLQVSAGTTVTWTNNDSVAHTVTADDGSFDSGTIQPGDTFSHTFTTAGTVAYHCAIHPFMTAEIDVAAATAGGSSTTVPAAGPASTSSAAPASTAGSSGVGSLPNTGGGTPAGHGMGREEFGLGVLVVLLGTAGALRLRHWRMHRES